jgi:hypothetical protein
MKMFKESNFITKLIGVVFLLHIGSIGTAAEISMTSRDNGKSAPTLSIKGVIKPGDYLRVLGAIADDGNHGSRFLLEGRNVIVDSPGGVVDDAIQIGRLFRDIYASVGAIGKCQSACFFLLAGGVRRFILADVGLHNPYFDDGAVSGMSVKSLDAALNLAASKTRQVLQEFGVPTLLIEKMASHTSVELYRPTLDDYLDYGEYASGWNQIRVSKCNADTNYERETYRQMLASMVGQGKAHSDSEMLAYERYVKAVRKCEDSIVGIAAARVVVARLKQNPGYLNVSQ